MGCIDMVHMPYTFLCVLVPRRRLRWAVSLAPASSAIVERVRLVPAFRLAVGQRSGLDSYREGDAITARARTSYLQSNGCHCENTGTTPSLAE